MNRSDETAGDGVRHLVCLSFALVWLGFQGFVNLHRYQAVSGNLVSLGDELNLNGEDAFRKELVSILQVNGVQVEPGEVLISFDQAKNASLVSAPCRWTLALPGHTFATQTTLRAFVRKKMYLPPE